MLSWEQINNPQLDIVGIVAVLGEGSTNRNAQASASGWHHILPRLLPAPQALLKHDREKRLPTVSGTVVGAYSGNVKFELNFFCQLLHADDLGRNEVELVEVGHQVETDDRSFYARLKRWLRKSRRMRNAKSGKDDEKPVEPFIRPGEQAYGVKQLGPLVSLSIFGCFMALGMVAASIVCEDGFALLATLLLAGTSSLVGLASWWRLEFKEDPPKAKPQKDRQNAIPDSDVVIYYPRQGAFRIVRCSENIARLYFRTELCEYSFGDNIYRILALTASISLMSGLLCMSNADTKMQIAFAASYILLNALYWILSALNPTGGWGHWKHKYKCTRIPVITPLSAAYQGTPPTRFNTQESFQNIPVRSQEPISPTGTDAFTRRDALIMTTKSSLDGATQSPTISIQVRQRKVTFNEDMLSDSASPLGLNIIHHEPASFTSDNSSPTAISPTQTVTPNSQKLERQNTKDMEGLKWRSSNPFGSIKDICLDMLNKTPLSSRPRSPKPQADSSQKSDTFTTALWKAIAVTGSTRWLGQTHIAPDNQVWTAWIELAGKRAATRIGEHGERVAAYTTDDKNRIVLPMWDYQGTLSELFMREADQSKRRPPPAPKLLQVVTEERNKRAKVKGITPSIEHKLRIQAKNARQRARTNRSRRAAVPEPQRHSLNVKTTDPDSVSRHDFARESRSH